MFFKITNWEKEYDTLFSYTCKLERHYNDLKMINERLLKILENGNKGNTE